jgi:VIT1/CCC1 family predicted Fe2+/Mn2+ transporter
MKKIALYVRTIVFGITDSLVSTVGLLAGIEVGGASHRTLALTGIVYAFVEAFSMAVGNFLSEESAEEYNAKADVSDTLPMLAGVVMFISFVLASFIPIVPYLLLSDSSAVIVSIAFSVLALFIVGLLGAKLAKLPMLVRGVRMALLGGAAILIGVLVGLFLPAN